MKRIVGYIVAIIQTHLDWIYKERERTGLTTWEKEQKRRRASLDEQK